MEYRDAEGLTNKSVANKTGATAFIKRALEDIPDGQGILMRDLASELQKAHSNVRDRCQAYVRIGTVLKRPTYKKSYVRKVDSSGYTYIVKLTVEEMELLEQLQKELEQEAENELAAQTT